MEMVFEISRLFPKEKGQKDKQWPQGNAKSQMSQIIKDQNTENNNCAQTKIKQCKLANEASDAELNRTYIFCCI